MNVWYYTSKKSLFARLRLEGRNSAVIIFQKPTRNIRPYVSNPAAI